MKAIRRIKIEIKTKIEIYHIYGHQDDNTDYALLPRDVQLNVDADAIAQNALEQAYYSQTLSNNSVYPKEGWHLWIENKKVNGRFQHNIRRHLGRQNLREYLYTRGEISWPTFALLDWAPLEKYMSTQSQEFKLWFSKHWSGFCGTGKMMQRMGLWDNNLCPCCKAVPEYSTSHLYLCHHPQIATLREKLFKNILAWLQEVDTEPSILHLITALWYDKQPCLENIESLPLRKLWNTMKDIGTQSMWKGLLPLGMSKLQHEHYQMIGTRKTGLTWAANLTGKVLRASLELWLKRNSILHATTHDGILGMERVALDTEIRTEKRANLQGIDPEDAYLMEIPLDTLLKETVEVQRGWLCSVKIARGDLIAARAERTRDRSALSFKQPVLTPREQRQYMDWRRVRLKE